MLQKSPASKALCRSTCNRGKQFGEAAADEEEEEARRTRRRTKSGDDKCMVCGVKEEDDADIEDWVACEMCSQWIHSTNHPYSISHADFHCHICLQ